MNISMSMIEGHLDRYDIVGNIQADDLSIHGMRFFSEKPQRFSPGYVYIGQAADFLRDTAYADALVLASGRSHIICKGAGYDELLNEVLSAFDFYNDIDQTLLRAATRHLALGDMLAALEGAMHNPFMVFGLDGTLLAGINLDLLPNNSLRASIQSNGSLGAATIGGYFVDERGEVQHDLAEQPLRTYNHDKEMAVSRYFSQDGETVGFVMCFPSSEAGTRFAISMEAAFVDYFAQASEFTDAVSPNQSRHLALSSLIAGEDVAEAMLGTLAKTIGQDGGYYLALVHSLVIRNRTQRLLLAREVEDEGDGCLACEVDERVAFLVSEANLARLLDQVTSRFDPKSAVVGVSMPFSNLQRCAIANRQAVFACDAPFGPGVRYSRDLAMPFMLGVLQDEPAVQDLLHPALTRLAEHDAQSGSELLDTLAAYIATGCNQVACAKSIHVHLNTLKYRLNRIAELAGIDFKDQDELFYLRLSLAILGRLTARS